MRAGAPRRGCHASLYVMVASTPPVAPDRKARASPPATRSRMPQATSRSAGSPRKAAEVRVEAAQVGVAEGHPVHVEPVRERVLRATVGGACTLATENTGAVVPALREGHQLDAAVALVVAEVELRRAERHARRASGRRRGAARGRAR
jgi:hypothetical protein